MLQNEQLKQFQPWLIVAVKGGSSVLPWINNPRDVDYVFFVRNNRDHKQLCRLYELKPKGECWFVRNIPTKLVHGHEYIAHYYEHIFGDDNAQVGFDIFEYSKEYKKILIEGALGKEYSPERKFWYHVLTGIYLLENGSYTLTDEQIKNVKLCHDKQMTQEIYNYIQEKLNNFKED